MAAMVWPLMGRIIKSTVGRLLWIIRILERWLERFDDKTVPLKEDQLPNENRQGQVNIPGEPENHQNATQIQLPREPENNPNVIPIPDPSRIIYSCALCNSQMQYKKARHGGYFYGCSSWPDCKGTRDLTSRKPGPVKEVNNLRKHYGEERWAEMEEMKCRGISVPLRLNRCLFCGMNPPNHLGRDCPQRQCPP